MDHQSNPRIVSAPGTPSLSAHRSAVAARRLSAEDAARAALAAAAAPSCRHAFVRRFDALALASAAALDQVHAAGAPLTPLAGAPVSIKDLYDVAGYPTTAGSRTLRDAEPARADALAVQRVRCAGAVLIGHTQMSEFAFSAVGINPHDGTPANAATSALDPSPRAPGGSTSGGAVSVATGAALAALGSDTGGSIRIPAALHGLVGFKNTQRLTPLQGTVPLSTTLDTVCAITRDVTDAIRMHELLADRRVALSGRPLRAWRLAVPSTLMLDAMDPTVAHAFERSLQVLRQQGAQIDEVAMDPLLDLAGLMANGGFAAAESWAWHRRRLAERGADYDPRVAQRIRRGEAISAADYIELHARRARWIERMTHLMHGYDALLSPTVPIVAPELEPLIASDERFFATNARLLRNPSVVNMLDGCAISLPCQAAGELPVGLMVWGGALSDDRVLDVALAIESTLRGPLAAGD
jgi:amidase/aspartyl-tRNA(Asn)/glutamyl-tRNA(Gln) amidotransferase subunit A